jgi:CubicO group peptidase (beta-lactamase class C family)
MMDNPSRRSILAATAAAGLLAPVTPTLAQPTDGHTAAMREVLDYAGGQNTTGFLIIQDRKTLVEKNWPLPAEAIAFRTAATYGTTADGALLEDVASQQKSFVSVLVGVAIDKGLLDVTQPVSAYIGAGWTKASPEQEAKIRVIDMLTMSSGLTTEFTYAAPPGTVFLYNTPVYAVTKRVVAAVAKQSIETVTYDWLTAPVGMNDTSWRKRPAAMADIGNPTGLVTSPRDVGRFGQMVLDGGKAADGRRIISEASLKAMFTRSATNPAYGRLWWLNGSAFTIKPLATRVDGPLIPAAPTDLVAALGALDRKLYVVPSRNLIVVRMGRSAPNKDFDQQLWLRLMKALA